MMNLTAADLRAMFPGLDEVTIAALAAQPSGSATTVPTDVDADAYEAGTPDAVKVESEREIAAERLARAAASDDPHERAWCLAQARDAQRRATRFSRRLRPKSMHRRIRVPRARQRERRACSGRSRRTATTRDDGGPGDPEPAELGPQLGWRHPLAGKYAHACLPLAVRS